MTDRLQAVGLRAGAASGDRRVGAETEICVVHLLRHANGLDTFRRFLDSYRGHSSGAAHSLALLAKGFTDESASAPYRRLCADVCDYWLEVPDTGFDLGAYRHAALALPHRKIVFMNSYSAIRAEGWLGVMVSIASRPEVGAVGASGSWGSQSSHLRYGLRLGGPYSRVFADRGSTNNVFAQLSTNAPEARRSGGRLRLALGAARSLIVYSAAFPAFPAPHLRSNGLLVDRDVWLRVCDRAPRDKLSSYRLESGRRGLTARLKSMGLRALVAGRDGRAYEPSQWPASHTFWQGEQENLLVEDNQTRAYIHGDAEMRGVLSGYAWGLEADPSAARLPEVV